MQADIQPAMQQAVHLLVCRPIARGYCGCVVAQPWLLAGGATSSLILLPAHWLLTLTVLPGLRRQCFRLHHQA